MVSPKHFLDLDQVDSKTLRQILDQGKAMKKARSNGGHDKPLAGKTLAMIFEKPSTRTRVSFEVGMRELGGETIMLGRTDTQLGRGETIADTARVLSRFVDLVMIRTFEEATLTELAEHATVLHQVLRGDGEEAGRQMRAHMLAAGASLASTMREAG